MFVESMTKHAKGRFWPNSNLLNSFTFLLMAYSWASQTSGIINTVQSPIRDLVIESMDNASN